MAQRSILDLTERLVTQLGDRGTLNFAVETTGQTTPRRMTDSELQKMLYGRLIVSSKAALTTLEPLDGESVRTLGYVAAGDGGAADYVYRSTGRSGVTVDNGWYIAGPLADDYYEAIDKQEVNLRTFGAKSDGVTTITAALNLATAAMVAAGGGVLRFSGGGTFLVATSATVPSSVRVKIDNGTMIKVTSGQVLDLQGGIDAGEYQVFDADIGGVTIWHEPGTATTTYPWLTIYHETSDGVTPRQRATHHQEKICALWFKGDCIGRKTNAGLAAGGSGARVYIPQGQYEINETINMAEEKNGGGGYGDHVIVEGGGFLNTHLYLQRDDMIAVDMQRGDEAVLRNLRILREPANGKTGVGVRVGGTTCIVTELWVGPLEYGIVCNAASRAIVGPHVTVEHCQYGLALLSGFEDETVGLDTGTNVRQSSFDVQSYECDTYGIWIERAELVDVTGVSGTFQAADKTTPGETVTINPGGKTAEVLRWNPTYNTLSLRFTGTGFNGVVTSGDTITGDTSAATCTASGNGVAGQSRGLQFVNCLLHVNGVSDVGSGCLMRGYVQNITFTGGHQYGEEGQYGFEIYNCEGVNITGYQFEGDAATSHIRVEDGDLSVVGCGFIGTLTPNAIDVHDADVKVVGCHFDSTITTPISYDLTNGGSMNVVANSGQANIVTGADGRKYDQFKVVHVTTNITTGDSKWEIHVDESLDGWKLAYVHAMVSTAGTTGVLQMQVRNKTGTVDMLTTPVEVDTGEVGSDTAATPYVIDAANAVVSVNDVIAIDVDAVHTTPAKGLVVTLGWEQV